LQLLLLLPLTLVKLAKYELSVLLMVPEAVVGCDKLLLLLLLLLVFVAAAGPAGAAVGCPAEKLECTRLTAAASAVELQSGVLCKPSSRGSMAAPAVCRALESLDCDK
jgi:hypothetical protein